MTMSKIKSRRRSPISPSPSRVSSRRPPTSAHLPVERQSLPFRLRMRALIRLSNAERRSVQEGRPDRAAALMAEAADVIERLSFQAF